MQTIEIKQNGNVYSCDIGISKDEWLDVLKSKDVSDSCKETLVKFFYSPGHRGSCKAVANVMGGNPQSLRSHITAVGQYVQNRLNRFQVIRPNGNPCYWIIPMSEGTDLPEGSEGVFEWQLRPELVEAIREYLYLYLVECYKNVRKNIPIKGPEWDEGYKWELITDCQGKDLLEIVSRVSKTNLIDIVRDKTVINYMVDNNPEAYHDVLKNLCKEEIPLDDRLTSFKQSMKAIVPDYINNKKIASKANDERTAASILSCYNPSAYTFYKYDLYKYLCKYLGISKKPKGQCYSHYLSLLHPLMMMTVKDKELQEMVSPYLIGKRKSDLLLAQDILWILMVQFPSQIGFFNSLLRPTKQRVWLWKGNANTVEMTTLRCGSSAKTIKDFREFKTKAELRKAYQADVGNKDSSIPGAYWSFVKEVKEDDYVVVFDIKTSEKGKQYHLLYGWGRITSDCLYDEDYDNPMARTVEWNLPFLTIPVIDETMGYDLFFESTTDQQANHIKELLNIETGIKMEPKYIDYIKQLSANKNMILTGAPGTGKTYLAKQIAMQMLGLDSIEKLKADKRFGFVQFHPSYDYTDFVEGLRPTKDVQNNVSGFVRKDGVFKEFCKHAILSESADADVLGNINNNPTVWKVSLEGTGDNPTRSDCMENGYIRIGWSQYGDVEDFLEFEDFKQGGKYVLRAFQSGMQIGDLVVSCYSAKEIDAVGVITGNYEYHPEGGKYPRYRTVKWLVKDIRENIVELNNNRSFTLSTVYKASITAEAALKIVSKYNVHQSLLPKNVDSVFIIDEINRGEISKIFGELFFSIDPGYRGTKGTVKTQYQNLIEEGDVFKEGFYVPENVYIIGTMNDIDRSVESMDFAMRRRFSWKEITSDFSQSMLDDEKAWDGKKPFQETIDEIKNRMNNLNSCIIDKYGDETLTAKDKIGLSKAYQIGASYFLKYGLYGDFDDLWNNPLEGLLFEYLRGTIGIEAKIERLHTAFNDKTAH